MSRELFQELRALLMERLDLARELSDEEILEEIDDLILGRMREYCLSLKEKVQLRQELFHSVRKLDVLQELIEDETVTEIMVNGPDAIFVERAGKLTKWDKTFTSGEKLEDVIQQIVGKCNRVVNESMPIVDARLDNGARVNAVIRPVALNGPILTIRRFPDTPITMEKLIALGSLPSECAEFLAALVRARYSMVIGGGTGSGKTTFLGALSNYIPPDERLITIEDNPWYTVLCFISCRRVCFPWCSLVLWSVTPFCISSSTFFTACCSIPAESLVASTQRATVRWVTSSCMSDYLLPPLPYRSWFTRDA